MLLEAFFALGEWRQAKIITDGEVVTLDHVGAPNFAALQVALFERRSQDLI